MSCNWNPKGWLKNVQPYSLLNCYLTLTLELWGIGQEPSGLGGIFSSHLPNSSLVKGYWVCCQLSEMRRETTGQRKHVHFLNKYQFRPYILSFFFNSNSQLGWRICKVYLNLYSVHNFCNTHVKIYLRPNKIIPLFSITEQIVKHSLLCFHQTILNNMAASILIKSSKVVYC